MATIVPTVARLSDHHLRVTWASMANGDVGESIASLYGHPDRSVQVKGTFGVGGTATIQGSNDAGVTFATLTDPQGTSLAVTSAGIKAVTEFVEHIRPSVAGDGTTSLTVVLIAKG